MIFKNWFGKKERKESIVLEGSLQIAEREKNLFDNALKLYVYVNHVPHKSLSDELAEQMKFCGNAVYSLIKNWLKDSKPSLEYMDFLNQKVDELRTLPKNKLNGLRILPHEIDQLELSESAKFSFRDADDEEVLTLTYLPKTGDCQFKISK